MTAMTTELMYDAVNPANLPAGDVYAGYVNGAYPCHGEVVAGFPHARVFGIDVIGDAWEQASILDYEEGNACFTPAVLKAWVEQRESFRPHTSVIYTDRANLPAVEAALGGLWHVLWVSTLDGTILTGQRSAGGNLIVATQYETTGLYDVSRVLSSWVSHPAPWT